MDLASQASESVAEDTQVLGRLHHEIASFALGDLDVALKYCGVAEAQRQRRNGHRLRDSAEIENTLFPQASQVEETVLDVFQSVQNHLRVTVQRGLAAFWLEKVFEILHVLGPNLLGPEPAVIVKVLPDIADNVCLLQEETHGLVQIRALQKSRVAKLGLDEQASKALADQTRHVVAVQVVFLHGLHARVVQSSLAAVVGHAIAHLVRNVLDDGLVRRLHVLEFRDHVVELDQQFPILLRRPIPVEGPAILGQEIFEIPEERLLGLQRNGSIILDGVQSTKHQVEHAHREQQLRMQLLDHRTETSTGLVEELKADLLGLGVILFVALVWRLVPDFPMRGER